MFNKKIISQQISRPALIHIRTSQKVAILGMVMCEGFSDIVLVQSTVEDSNSIVYRILARTPIEIERLYYNNVEHKLVHDCKSLKDGMYATTNMLIEHLTNSFINRGWVYKRLSVGKNIQLNTTLPNKEGLIVNSTDSMFLKLVKKTKAWRVKNLHEIFQMLIDEFITSLDDPLIIEQICKKYGEIESIEGYPNYKIIFDINNQQLIICYNSYEDGYIKADRLRVEKRLLE